MSASYETAHSFIGPFSAKNDVIIFHFIIKTEYTYQGEKGHLNNKSKKENQKWAVGKRGKIILGGEMMLVVFYWYQLFVKQVLKTRD